MRHGVVLALWSLLALTPAAAAGGPPMLTDDPETPGDGAWEVNLALTIDLRRHEKSAEAPVLDANYGLGERVQLKYELPWLAVEEDDEAVRDGLGDSLVGVKWRFLDEPTDGASVSVYPQFEFENPTSSRSRGIVDTGMSLLLPVEVSRRIGPIEVNLEGGYRLVEERPDEWIAGLVVGWPSREGTELMGEVRAEGEVGHDRWEVVGNLGMVLDLASSVMLLGSVGRGLCSSGGEDPDWLGYLGFQVRF